MCRGMSMQVFEHRMLADVWPYGHDLPSEKGYPAIFDKMNYWVLFIKGVPVGYTGSLDMGNFIFVGNTYISKPHRKNGNHSFLLSERNKKLPEKPKITILNPIEESQMFHLVKVVERLGYRPVYNYDDVADIMDKEFYLKLLNAEQQIWRMD